MPFISASTDGTRLHYLDYIPAQDAQDITLVFLHGWPMSALMFEGLMLPLCETHRLRCVALDRRGFGGSEWVGTKTKKEMGVGVGAEVSYELFARDTLDVLEGLGEGLGKFMFVGSSMGCGESVVVYNLMNAQQRERCAGMVWLGAALPCMLRGLAEGSDLAPPRELWDAILAGLRADRAGFVKAGLPGIFRGRNKESEGPEVSEGVLSRFEYIVQQADGLAVQRCVGVVTGRDFSGCLKVLGEGGLGVLVLHGDCDQGAPYEATAKRIGELMPQAHVRIYEGAAHGLYVTHAARVVEDIVGFIEQVEGCFGVRK